MEPSWSHQGFLQLKQLHSTPSRFWGMLGNDSRMGRGLTRLDTTDHCTQHQGQKEQARVHVLRCCRKPRRVFLQWMGRSRFVCVLLRTWAAKFYQFRAIAARTKEQRRRKIRPRRPRVRETNPEEQATYSVLQSFMHRAHAKPRSSNFSSESCRPPFPVWQVRSGGVAVWLWTLRRS